MDAYDDDRPYIYDYIINRFGKDKTARVLALGTVSDKGTIDDIGRALEIPLDDVKRIKEEYDTDKEKCIKEYPNLFYYFDGIKDTYVSQSIHAAGIIASPITLKDNYGTFISSDGTEIISLDMDAVHEVGLVKYDILAIRQIGIIDKTCKYAGINYPKSNEINWSDPLVWDDMKKSPIAIFQFEGSYAFSILKQFGTKSIEDMSLVTAMIRPSGASYRDKLSKHIINKNPSKLIDDLLADNLGFLVYQEDIISFLQEICGLSGSEADNVRRAIGRFFFCRVYKKLYTFLGQNR